MRGMRGGIGRLPRAEAAALAAVTVVHLGAQLVSAQVLAGISQVLLTPLLLLALLTATTPPRGRLVRLFALGLVLSWLGDALPRLLHGQVQFLAMLGPFLLAQIVYGLALWPLRCDSLLVRPVAVLPYLTAAVVIVVLCAPSAGLLLPALVAYAAVLGAMAVLATSLGRRGGLGGAVFVLSDALIALGTFDVLTLPAHPVWVMASYVAAQVLLVLGVLERQGREPGAREL